MGGCELASPAAEMAWEEDREYFEHDLRMDLDLSSKGSHQ